jgi:hypothetical protein
MKALNNMIKMNLKRDSDLIEKLMSEAAQKFIEGSECHEWPYEYFQAQISISRFEGRPFDALIMEIARDLCAGSERGEYRLEIPAFRK